MHWVNLIVDHKSLRSKYIFLDGLLCSVAEHFMSCAVFNSIQVRRASRVRDLLSIMPNWFFFFGNLNPICHCKVQLDDNTL